MTAKAKAYIIDDELLCIEALKWDLTHDFSEIEVVGYSTNPLIAIDYLKKSLVDILFLDINMPEMTGFDVLEALGFEFEASVIFITAYDDHALRAFEVNAIDYILKPTNKKDLKRAIDKALKYQSEFDLEPVKQHLQLLQSPNKNLSLPTSEGIEIIPVKEILYCQADSNYALVHLTNDRKISVSKPLKFIESKLNPNNFLRVHQSYLVNSMFVRKLITKGDSCLVLENNASIPVSRRYRNSVQAYFS